MRTKHVSFLGAILAVLFASIWFGAFSTTGNATPEFSKKEKKACTVCHVKTGSKELNDVGKYYQEKKTLEGSAAK